MNSPEPTCVIFDQDGTLVDSLPGIEFSANVAFHACGMTHAPVQLRGIIGPPIRFILSQAGGVTDPHQLDDLEAAFRKSYDTQGWQKAPCFPNVSQTLQAMRLSRHRLFVATNKPRDITIRILRSHDIMKYFDAVVTRDSRKPAFSTKGEMLEFLIASHGLQKSHCIFVGDTQEDADAASECSIEFAFASYGYGTITTEVSVRRVLTCFTQLPQLVSPELAHDR